MDNERELTLHSNRVDLLKYECFPLLSSFLILYLTHLHFVYYFQFHLKYIYAFYGRDHIF